MDDNGKRMARVPVILTLAGFIIVVAGMKAASSLLVPFFVAVFIAVICAPPLFWLQRKGVPKVIALISYSRRHPVFGSTLWSIGRFFTEQFFEFPSRLPSAIVELYCRHIKLAARKGR